MTGTFQFAFEKHANGGACEKRALSAGVCAREPRYAGNSHVAEVALAPRASARAVRARNGLYATPLRQRRQLARRRDGGGAPLHSRDAERYTREAPRLLVVRAAHASGWRGLLARARKHAQRAPVLLLHRTRLAERVVSEEET